MGFHSILEGDCDLADDSHLLIEAQVSVSEDADVFKTVADQQGLRQPVCQNHVVRNSKALIENLTQAIQTGANRS